MDKPDQEAVHILIVEDNRGDVRLVREALKESSLRFELTHLADGEQAFDYLRRRGQHLNAVRPHLILLDLNLPRRDGWEILDEIRASADLQGTPVVILSSSGNPEDRERAARRHSILYIRKPSTLDEFLAVGKQIEQFWRTVSNGEVGGPGISG
jgi:chemotaxis family two-component system response regulator Rcp1